jgi:alcohol dehydrogenase, propanol-preferring
MKAMVLHQITSLDVNDQPLTAAEWPVPVAGPGQVLIQVSVCGVCHTELEEIEGRTAPPQLRVIQGQKAKTEQYCGRCQTGNKLFSRIG